LSNPATAAYLKHAKRIVVYDRTRIATEYIDFDASEGINDSFTFGLQYTGALELTIAKNINIFVFPAQALELVKL